jgi:CubicO group peptidase (beta-lactamase class C family)
MILAPPPAQPSDVAWPTKTWPEGGVPAGVDSLRLNAQIERAFAGADPDLGESHALVIIQGGRLLLERYAPGFGPLTTCRSWSMAKSITHALTGLLVADGRIDIFAPADVPEWSAPGDPRGAITLDQLLRMSSGLAFREAYVPGEPSDVIEMLSGAGRADMAAFAASFPLAHRPGAYFY